MLRLTLVKGYNMEVGVWMGGDVGRGGSESLREGGVSVLRGAEGNDVQRTRMHADDVELSLVRGGRCAKRMRRRLWSTRGS